MPTAVASRARKSANHGAFKHRANPATLEHVMKTYGISRRSLDEVRAYVFKRLNKNPEHARKAR